MKGRDSQRVEMIAMEKLVPHPMNANVMGAGVREKLRRHIERTGRYEPLVVRRHPARAGCFELINGHHRKRVLEELGHKKAACVVWEVDDAETLMLLATVNRLSGRDAGNKRLELLEALAKTEWAGAAGQKGGALAAWLPEDERTLRKLLEEAGPVAVAEAPRLEEMPEALTVFMTRAEKERVVGVLRKVDGDLGRALVMIVRAGRVGRNL